MLRLWVCSMRDIRVLPAAVKSSRTSVPWTAQLCAFSHASLALRVNTAQSRCSSLRSGPAGLQEMCDPGARWSQAGSGSWRLPLPNSLRERHAQVPSWCAWPRAVVCTRVCAGGCVHVCVGSHLTLHCPTYVECWVSSRASTHLPGSPCPLFGPLYSLLPDKGRVSCSAPRCTARPAFRNDFCHLAACSLPDFVVSAAGGCFVSSALKS